MINKSKLQAQSGFDKSFSQRNVAPSSLSSFVKTKKILEPSASFQMLDDDQRSSKSIASGFKERRFQLKMDKLKKMYQKQTSSDIADMISVKSKLSRPNSIEKDPEESYGLLRTKGLTSATESIVNSRTQLRSELKRADLQSATSSNVGTIESEFKRNMGLNSLDSSQSMRRAKFIAREKHIRFAQQPSFHSASSRVKQSIKNEIDLDVKPDSDSSDVDTIRTETFQGQSSQSSFNPNTIEYSRHQSTFKAYAKKSVRLRDFKEYNKCILLPDDPLKIKWNVFLLVVILISSVTTPFRVAFYQNDDTFWIVYEAIIDFVFVIDIIISFFSAFYDSREALVFKKKEIAISYLKSWFAIDFISVFPLNFIANSTVNELGNLARFPRIYKIAKTAKFIRAMKIGKVKAKIKKEITKISDNNIEFQRVLTYFFIFIVLCHNLACLWYLIAKLSEFNEDTWVVRFNYSNSDIQTQYLASLYFIVTTITTVGFGDITSKTPSEQTFSLILMIIGVISFSVAISSFTSMITVSDQKKQKLRQKLKVLGHIRSEYNLGFELYWRLRQSLHYEHSMDMSDQQTFISELPSKLKVELSNIMYSQELGKINYFKNKSPQFITAIAPYLKPVKVNKEEYVYLKGESIDGIYFIKKGDCAYVEKRPHADFIFGKNFEGSYFGDIDFTASNQKEEAKRIFAVKALSDMDLLLLEKQDLYQIDVDYKKEIFQLFHRSHAELQKLKNQNRRGSLWLQTRFNSFGSEDIRSQRREREEAMQRRNQDNSNEWEDRKTSDDAASRSDKLPVAPARTTKGPPLRRAVTIHKPTKIGKILSETMGGKLIEDETKSDEKEVKSNKKKNRKKLKVEAKYHHPAIIRVTPAEVIQEVDQNFESGGTLHSPVLRANNIRRASRFTIPQHFEQQEDDNSDEQLEIESEFDTSNNNLSGTNQQTSVDKIVLED